MPAFNLIVTGSNGPGVVQTSISFPNVSKLEIDGERMICSFTDEQSVVHNLDLIQNIVVSVDGVVIL